VIDDDGLGLGWYLDGQRTKDKEPRTRPLAAPSRRRQGTRIGHSGSFEPGTRYNRFRHRRGLGLAVGGAVEAALCDCSRNLPAARVFGVLISDMSFWQYWAHGAAPHGCVDRYVPEKERWMKNKKPA
jgi:hypothetical protein